ncbi:MAG: substrate-binding periplasmic protein [Eubacterium sp.]
MKTIKKFLAVILSVVFIAACFAGCSSNDGEKYSDETLIIGYTEAAEPFLIADKDGNVTGVKDGSDNPGFEAELWNAIFDNVKGDLKSYVFEKVDEGYQLEEDGGFFDSNDKEYSAALLMGAVSKNNGTFNEDYSFTEPIITDRVIAVVSKNSKIASYADFAGAKAVTVSDIAKTAFEKNSAISSACASVTESAKIEDALALLDSGKADVVITDEFNFMPYDKADSYTVLDHEIDTIEYVIACAKHSGWKDSINEAIRQLKSDKYDDGDFFTPIVEKYFGYNASSFNYEAEGDK